MKLLLSSALLVLIIAGSLAPAAASPDSRQHRAAMKLCKQKYRDAVRGVKYLRGRQRRERIAQASQARAECERLAPR